MSQFIYGTDNNNVDDKDLLERIRLWRNAELAQSDWTQLPDAPVDKLAWAEYRQALRDLPVSANNPKDIELPIKPNG